MLHVRDNDQWSARCWKRWLQRGLPLCERSSAAAAVRSFPFPGLQWHTSTHRSCSIPPHTSICTPVWTPTHTHTHAHALRRTHINLLVRPWKAKCGDGQTEGLKAHAPQRQPRCMTQFREHAQSHQNMLFVTRPRKTCLSCCPLRVMCSPTRRSKYNYSASQWPPFIVSDGKSSAGSDLNMTAGTYHRIFESKAGESRGIILLWSANAFTPTQIDSPWQKRLCCLF